MNLQALCAVLPPTDVTHEHFGAQSSGRFLGSCIRLASSLAHLLVLDECFGVKSALTPIAFLQNILLEVILCDLVVQIHPTLTLWATLHASELLWRLREWLTLSRWFLCFSCLPLFLASFEVDFQTCSAKFTATDVADEGLGLLYLTCRFPVEFAARSSYATEATSTGRVHR